MRGFLDRLEKKLGGRAVPHLTAVMIGCFVIGYIFKALYPNAVSYMNLNVEMILQGEVWRLLTWVVVPPQELNIFTLIMLFFYFSIGNALERAWGEFRYNVYIFGGMLIFVLTAFISYFVFSALPFRFHHVSTVLSPTAHIGYLTGAFFTTDKICTSLLLAFAATFPDATVLLMMVIPVKMKYMGWLYGAVAAYECIQYIRVAGYDCCYLIYVVAFAAAMLNFLLFFFSTRRRMRPTSEQRKRQKEFRKAFEAGQKRYERASRQMSPEEKIIDVGAFRHRCEICGRTDRSDPDLEFRYCSKCEGDHEYCMDHLYTHQHIHG